MSEANKLLLKRWFEQVWNQKSEAAIDEMFHKQGKSHGFPDADSVLVGPEPFKAVHRTFVGAFLTFTSMSRTLLPRVTRSRSLAGPMTHLGDHLGFPATLKKGTLDGSSFR